MNHALNDPVKRITASLILLALCFCSAGLRGARASLDGIRAMRDHGLSVKTIQEYHAS